MPTATSELLEAATTAQAAARAADIDLAIAVARWATAHPEPSQWPLGYFPEGLAGLEGTDVELMLAGPGAPGVSEFAVIELAAALGMSTDSGRHLVGDILELMHRLPRLWDLVLTGRVLVWQARRTAQHTRTCSKVVADYVDRQIHAAAGKIGPTQLERLIDTAKGRFDPGAVEDEYLIGQETRHFTIHTHPTDVRPLSGIHTGVVQIEAELDYPDALDLDAAIGRIAHDLALAGSMDPLDVRRAKAAGELARRQTSLDLHDGVHSETDTPKKTPARQVVIYVHLSEAALTGAPGTGTPLARVEGHPGAITAEAIPNWCRDTLTKVTIRPVIDYQAGIHVNAYEAPDRIREQVIARDHTCVFPWCNRPARRTDLDHIVPYDPAGPPGQTNTHNLAALCRRHHRAKTFGGWNYRPVDPITDPGSYRWTSPHGATYLRTPTGTTRE